VVQNTAYLKRKFRGAPKIVHERLERGLERIGDDIVREMSALNPLPGDIQIMWTWGDAPKGAVTLGKFGKAEQDSMSITIYARGETFAAHWFEFGTARRFQKTTGRYTGFIAARPFFYPVWRANRASVRRRLNGILRRAIRKANQI
jgi:hypothetical protein